MDQKQECQTNYEVRQAINKAAVLEKPAIPVDFMQYELYEGAGNLILGILNSGKIEKPELVAELFNIVLYAGWYLREYHSHGGLVPQDTNESAGEYLIRGLQLMSELGHGW